MHPRLTVDYGVRLTHSGGYYDTRKSTAGFYEPDWNRANAPRLCLPGVRPVCGEPTCAANNQRAVDLANPTVLHRPRSSAILSQALGRRSTAWCTTAIRACGRAVLDYAPLVAAPQGGFRMGYQRRRQAGPAHLGGSSMRFPNAKTGRTSSATRRLPSAACQWASLSDIENFATSNIAFVETPVTAEMLRRRTTVAREVLQRERDLSA